jgi:hypothetical protein
MRSCIRSQSGALWKGLLSTLLAVTGIPCLAQGPPSLPELNKQRMSIFLAASRTSLAKVSPDLDRLAITSESCRLQRGSKACGLVEQPLRARTIEERFDYYVQHPLQATLGEMETTSRRENWNWSAGRPSADSGRNRR